MLPRQPPTAQMSLSPARPSDHAAVRALVLALTALGCDRDPGDGGGGGSETPAPADSTGAAVAAAIGPSDVCEGAPIVTQGLYEGSLRDTGPDPATAGVCGHGGPDAFLRVEVTPRADLRVEARGRGFVARASLAPDDCGHGRELVCSDTAGPLELRDLDPGTVVRVSIGIDPAVFADLNQTPAPESGPDPLSYAVDIDLTRVLAAGEPCLPASRGRCTDGTLCLPDADGGDAACTPLAGDTCASAVPTALPLDAAGLGAITVHPALPQTDAHRHSCTGDGQRERVLRLELPPTPPQRALELTAGRPDVGLAVRAPGCLAAAEVACAAPTATGARVVLTGLAGLRSAGVEPLLFVELPAGSEQDPPFDLNLRLVPEPATWGDP